MAANENRIARLDELLQRACHDAQLYCTTVPRFSEETIAAYAQTRPRSFARVLVALARHTSEDVPYELCDELAAFYARVFAVAGNAAHRRLALAALLALGPPRRRYPVADVVRSVLWSVHARADVALVVAVLRESPWAAWYAHHHTFRGPLDARVAAALAQAARSGGASLSARRAGRDVCR